MKQKSGVETQLAKNDYRGRVWTNLSEGAKRNPFFEEWLCQIAHAVKLYSGLQIGSLKPESGDVVHLHFIEHSIPSRLPLVPLWRLVNLVLWLNRLKQRGVATYITVHNLRQHERRSDRAVEVLWWVLPKLIRGFLVHADGGVKVLRDVRPGFRRIRAVECRHPLYAAPEIVDRRREKYAYDVVHIGSVREYKRVDELATVLRGSGLSTCIAGAVSDPQLLAPFLNNSRTGVTQLDPDTKTLWKICKSAGVVVFPQNPQLASGSMVFALSAGAKLLCRRSRYAEELQEVFGRGRVWLYDGDLRVDDLHDVISSETRSGLCPSEYSWPSVVRAHCALWWGVNDSK